MIIPILLALCRSSIDVRLCVVRDHCFSDLVLVYIDVIAILRPWKSYQGRSIYLELLQRCRLDVFP